MAPGGLRKPQVAHKGPKDSQKAQEAPGSEHIWYFRRDFIALLVKRDVLTAVLCAKVHFDSCFAYTIFDKCYESPIKITIITPKAPEGSKNGLDKESTIKLPRTSQINNCTGQQGIGPTMFKERV